MRISIALLLMVGSFANAAAGAPKEAWKVTQGLDTPESAYYDEATDRIYVSNIAGTSVEKDGKGWISVFKTDGTVATPKLVEGLNAPKGIAVHQGTLWVADIDEVIGIDLKAASIKTRVPVAGAKFLNDVTVGSDGTVYVSDMLTDQIIAVKDGKASVFISGPELEHPNGLYMDGKTLRVVGWGKDMGADFTTKTSGGFYAIDLGTKKRTEMLGPLGNLDGLEKRKGDGWLISDWVAGKVYFLATKGKKPEELISGLQSAADIGYISKQDVLLVPDMKASTLHAYQLSK